MSKKIVVLGIVFVLASVIIFRGMDKALTVEAENLSGSATYNEQQGYSQFLKQVPQQKWGQMNWNPPFYMINGGLPRVIRNCEAHIAVNQLLIQQEIPEEKPIEEPKQQEQRKKIALTFDDGPNDKSTVQILNVLHKYHVKATFFVLGQNVAKYPHVVKMIHEQGHEVANHSWSHKNLTKLKPEQMHAEIDRTNEAIFEAIGQYPTTYRPPYGAINDEVRAEIKLKSVLWNIDTLDWQHKNPRKTLEIIKRHAKARGVILMHDIHQESADALESVILFLLQQDYEFVTMDEFEK